MQIIETSNLNKIYSSKIGKHKVAALQDFTITINSGEIFGLLGPNGAGKTTLIKILLGIVFPTSGSAKLFGEDISNYELRKKIGYLPENHKFPNFLSAENTLKYFAKLSNNSMEISESKIDELLALVKLSEWKKVKIKKFSKGMMQRLGLAQALIHNPELIFLDEPTDGVDPIGRKEIRDILIDLKQKGKTIFINSHLLSEVELVSNRVAILNKGKLIKEGSVSELTKIQHTYIIETSEPVDWDLINAAVNVTVAEQNGNKIALSTDSKDELNKLLDKIRSTGIQIESMNQKKLSLEEMFITLVKESENIFT